VRSPLVQPLRLEREGSARRANVLPRAPEPREFPIVCRPSSQLSSEFSADVLLCDVTAGPTRSWKDCAAPIAVEDAVRSGHRQVVVASSGNHGRAIAHACRARGLKAAVLVYERTPADVVASLLALDAEVYRAPDRAAVHAALAAFRADGWYAATLLDELRASTLMPGAVGYQRIARAIADAVADDPIVVVPTCYGDGATAIEQHLLQLGRQPTMCLVRAAAGDKAIAASIATDVMTPQVATLHAAGAIDVGLEDEAFRAGVVTMNAAVGKRLDLAEGGTPGALAYLADIGLLRSGRSVVCVVTGALYPGLSG
jgi:threonine dehydratase